MANKTNIFTDKWVDIVFEDRNKAYGAYELRKKSSDNIIKGIIFAIIFFTLSVSMPVIMRYIEGITANDEVLKVTEVNTLAEPPPIDKNEPPPPPVEPPPPLKSTVKFTPPVIKPDEEVREEDQPPIQEEMKDKDAGAKTQEGDPNGVPDGLGKEVVEEAPATPFTIVEQMPEFPGGEGELMKYLGQKIVYPPIAKDNGIQGKVYVNFVVDANGDIRDAKVVRGIGGGCDEEALRVVKSMPKWKAGKQNGRTVPVYYNLPIKFTLR